MDKNKGFRKWFKAGFGSELLPIIPPGARLTKGSTVRPEHRGKTPGVLNSSGTWSGLGGKWSDELRATVTDGKLWESWGASVGLQSRELPGLDIDVEDAAIAQTIEMLALEKLGIAPVRVRAGSARRLLVYLRAGATPIHKRRVAWIDRRGVKHAVELLGVGQQYLVAGPHPKGGEYEWRHDESPCEWGRDNLTEIDAEKVDEFFQELEAAIDCLDWGTITRGQLATLGASHARRSLDAPELHASRPELVLEALKAWPNTADNVPTHDDFVTALAAIKAALGPNRDDFYSDVEDWALGYDGNDADYVRKVWDSVHDAALGAEWLFQAAKAGASDFTGDAQEDFDDDADTDAAIGKTPLELMLDRYVWCQQLERYVDIQTGDSISARGLNSANVKVAAYGRTGIQSAEAAFQNDNRARKVAIATFRPGSPLLLRDANTRGKIVPAVNLWSPSTIVPLEGITDDDVRPWLDHIELIFGPVGDPAREHFLDFWGFALQKPGHKISHALVIYGEQGVGKDTALVPIFRAIGSHNVKQVETEDLVGQWSHFLLHQVVSVQEMHNFTKREIYNRLKQWISAPPYTVSVNRKNQNQFDIPNVQLWVFFTNHDDAIALDEGDRRFWVHRAYLETPREPDYYRELYRWFDEEEGAAKVAGWLRARDVARFNPGAPPPITDAKREMLELARPAPVRWLDEQLGEGGPFAGRELMTARELLEHARDGFNAPGKISDTIRERHATAALKRAGYRVIDRKVKLAGNVVVRLWTRGAPELFAQLDHAALLKRYEQEITKTEPQRKGA